MRQFRFPTVPDQSSNSSPGLVVAALFILIVFALGGFHWWMVFVAIAIGATTDAMLGIEKVEEPKVDTEIKYRAKGE